MAGHANKKQRHEAKRKAKRLAARRRDSISPAKRLADASGEIECWASCDFERMGQMQIFVHKRCAGFQGVACYLVDRGVVGLKDSWVSLDVDRRELQEMLDASKARGISMQRIETVVARKWVSAAARWAHENGMKLPKDWLKHVALIGGAGDWQAADVSDFVKEFAGHPEDLRQRVVGESLESFLQRDDIHFIFSEGAPYKDQRSGEYVPALESDELGDEESSDETDEEDESPDDEESLQKLIKFAERLDLAADTLAAKTEQWLAELNQTAAPNLGQAWKSVITCVILARSTLPDGGKQEVSELAGSLLNEAIRLPAAPGLLERKRAVSQALDHLEANSLDFEQIVRALGPPVQPG